jgi:hypothetical protein
MNALNKKVAINISFTYTCKIIKRIREHAMCIPKLKKKKKEEKKEKFMNNIRTQIKKKT